MRESLPWAFAVYPIVLSGAALAWVLGFRLGLWPHWLVRVAACASVVVFAFLAGPWAFSSYYLRYLLPGLFAVVVLISYFRARRRRHRTVGGARRTGLSALVLFLFSVLDALVIASHYPSAETTDVVFPFAAGTYYVLQGGDSVITNPFHSLGGSRLALDIVKLTAWGNRATGIAPRSLQGYAIFGEKLHSPCGGVVVKVCDGLVDTAPGHPDTAHPEGNHVVLRCAQTEILMAHLKRGSVAVRAGETVGVGRLLAEIGNSGNTLEPHLHIGATRGGLETALRFDGRSLSLNSLIKATAGVRGDNLGPGVQIPKSVTRRETTP